MIYRVVDGERGLTEIFNKNWQRKLQKINPFSPHFMVLKRLKVDEKELKKIQVIIGCILKLQETS